LLATVLRLASGWALGRWVRPPVRDKAENIWTAIDKAARAAVLANAEDLAGRCKALLLAVAALSQHWRQRSARIAERRTAQRELSLR
jgi:hypothetical protein